MPSRADPAAAGPVQLPTEARAVKGVKAPEYWTRDELDRQQQDRERDRSGRSWDRYRSDRDRDRSRDRGRDRSRDRDRDRGRRDDRKKPDAPAKDSAKKLESVASGGSSGAPKKETPAERIKRLMAAQLNKQAAMDSKTTAQRKLQEEKERAARMQQEKSLRGRSRSPSPVRYRSRSRSPSYRRR